ncbi:Piso0_001580 [Millerozyma farinosa CBS 7064]|uniref:Piso0_001580 protein n=1 Tax=Pichia sorbitophila (strain ATCC MYA-4447 / BCRC 22081 / CBS 7064 / NBRC 10061 / NRRL Y-12695) TaxID=559304 RepID=G8YNJ4_PICSO|nr:Piso0_001580 [Millerozyma farinosa CBS 7064]
MLIKGLSVRDVCFLAVVIFILLGFHFRNKIAAAHDRFRSRRRLRYSRISEPTGFEEDLEYGLSSNYFDLHENISNEDSRAGLESNAKTEIKKIMELNNIGFDEARLIYTRRQMKSNNIGSNGESLDPKAVTFSNSRD